MIDVHTHLNFPQFDHDLADVLKRMKKAGVNQAIVVGTDQASNQKAVEVARQYQLWAALGFHPEEFTGQSEQIPPLPADLTRVVAVGEVGLDYSFVEDEKMKSYQQQVLIEMIDQANQAKLPVIFHVREAMEDFLKMVRQNPPQFGGVVHCFHHDEVVAHQLFDLKLVISVTAMITYPKNEALRQTISRLPHNLVMVETDCPLLPPQSKRGQRCEPADVIEVASAVGQAWKKDVEYVDQVTTATAMQIFHRHSREGLPRGKAGGNPDHKEFTFNS